MSGCTNKTSSNYFSVKESEKRLSTEIYQIVWPQQQTFQGLLEHSTSEIACFIQTVLYEAGNAEEYQATNEILTIFMALVRELILNHILQPQ